VKNDRRELASSAPECRSPAETAGERRSPAFYATRRDVVLVVALVTLLDSLAKLAVVLAG
jgi:hypothetical protein